jgi:uncharacterized OB-fold protein
VSVPRPRLVTTDLSRHFWEAAADGRLEVQRCRSCDALAHYPRELCSRCWSTDLVWEATRGRGTVRTFTVIHRPGHPAWDADAPYVVALIQLDEGPTLLSNVVDIAPSEVRVGLPVSVRFRRDGDLTLPQFAPSEPP